MIYADGREVSIGIACDQHNCTFDEETGVWLVYPDAGGNLPE